MKRIPILTLGAVVILAMAGCGKAGDSSAPAAGSHSACETAMVQELRTAAAQGASASPQGRPPACIGVSDKLLQQYAAQAMQEVFSGTASPFPFPSITMPSIDVPTDTAAGQFTIPDLTGMTLDVADSLASSSGEYTTPQAADGNSPTIASPGDWTVCTQTPAAGTQTGSNGIIVTVVDTAAGKQC